MALLETFSTPKRLGYGLVADFDLNSDRLNMVVINRQRVELFLSKLAGVLRQFLTVTLRRRLGH